MTTNSNDSIVSISEYQKGTTSNLECGGPTVGMCDRSTGLCMCTDGYGSSNSSNAPGDIILQRLWTESLILYYNTGSRGDCGYRLSYLRKDKITVNVDGSLTE